MRVWFAITALTLLPAPALAGATDWRNVKGGTSIEASISETAMYDSNPLRTAGGGQSILGSITSPQLTIRSKTPTTRFEAITQLDQNLFNHSEYNSTDASEKLYLSHENAQWLAEANASITRNTTRTSELTNYTNKQPRVERTQLSASPKLTYRISETDRIALSTALSQVHYQSTNFNDYALYSVNPNYSHKLDAKHELNLGVNMQRYETLSGTSLTSDSYGPTIGLTTIVSPRLTTRLSAGAQQTEKRGANSGSKTNDWNYVFALSADYRGTVDTITAQATRAREPFGNGTETLLTAFSVKERHAVTPRTSLTAQAMYQTADYTTEPGINLDHAYGAGAGTAYKLTENIDLTGDYLYRKEKLTHTSADANEHIVLAGLNYRY